ncbi:MAG TPA: hypothetical protein VMR90_13255 [Candidatus Cybelea sp.]|nr:hypothetical protein [Candidatus Cybelea sp.]
MARRRFVSQLLGLPFLALGAKAQESKRVLKIMMRSSWGTDDPTRASFVFAHALALSDAGHEVQIFLTADANYLMRKATSDAVIPMGWPPLSESREKVVAKRIPVFALRSLLPGPWGLGNRSRELEREVRESCRLRFPSRVG